MSELLSLSSSQRASGCRLACEPSAPGVGRQSSIGRWLDGRWLHWHRSAGLPIRCGLHAPIQLEVATEAPFEEG